MFIRDGSASNGYNGGMLLLRTTARPATDLGFLLHKNPGRTHSADLPFGRCHVVFPEANEEACTAALILEVDTVGLVRREGSEAAYVTDRPYVASSYLSTAMTEAFRTAMAGRSKERPELAERALPFEATLPAVTCRGGEALLRRLFEPLGYAVEAEALPIELGDGTTGESRTFSVRLAGTVRLADLLNHLYVLVPVLDDEKHYYVDRAEIDKLLAKGGEWLKAHPERETIARRYLARDRRLTREALARLTEADGDPDPDAEIAVSESPRLRTLHDQRLDAVKDWIQASGAKSVLDLGCGEGRLLKRLLPVASIERLVGVDASVRALTLAKRTLRWDQLTDRQLAKLRLVHGALTYRDPEFAGFDFAALVEVIEHLDPPRLASLERVVFEFAQPREVAVTTPNAEYNVRFPTLEPGAFRHRDHRFEWTRSEFETWATGVAERHGYSVAFEGIGEADPEVGCPSRGARFRR